MVMFTAYFDASGNAEDQPNLVVSGYIANMLQWSLFENLWRNVHVEYGVDLPFHMAELIAATQNVERYEKQKNARKDYIALGRDVKRANDFFTRLSIAEATIVSCAVTCIVPMSVYNEINSLLDLRTRVPPYAVAARACIELVRQWESNFKIKESVECIFEEGDFEQGKFTDLMIDEGMPIPVYKKKQDFAGLQAADHYAWERAFFAKTHERLLPRESFKMLLNGVPQMQVQATGTMLVNICHLKKIDPRTGIKHEPE